MAEEDCEQQNPEKIDGQLPTIQDVFNDDDINKIKKKMKNQFTK